VSLKNDIFKFLLQTVMFVYRQTNGSIAIRQSFIQAKVKKSDCIQV